MPELNCTEEFMEKIASIKEVLSTMPKNNEKNIKKYNEKIRELEEEYQKYQEKISNILENKFYKATKIDSNKEIENLRNRIETIEKIIYLLNDSKTVSAKLGLDKNAYALGKYYKENLENTNRQIFNCIDKFKKLGINLTAEDFDYSIYASEYMKTFFEVMEKNDLNSDILKAKFEDIYWKCPDIITHIELNIRNLYLKNQSAMDKYLQKEKVELLKKWNKKPEEIINSYLDLKKRLNEETLKDRKILLDMFLQNKLNVADYTDQKLESNLEKILSEDVHKEEKNKEIIENINKFLNSLYEYKNYMRFEFIIEDIKKYYEKKEEYKKVYSETRKKIDNAEKKLKKLNKKINSKSIFVSKDKKTTQNTEFNATIKELKELYKELKMNEFYNKIYTDLNENSTIYDVLYLANAHYYYLVDCFIRNNQEISQEEIDDNVEALNNFLLNPYNTVIYNIPFLEQKDLAVIIKDRYRLLNFKVEKENLSEDNIDSLIDLLKNVCTGINIREAKLDIEEIEELCKIKKILKK